MPILKETYQKVLINDNITSLNCLFAYDYIKGNLPKSFNK